MSNNRVPIRATLRAQQQVVSDREIAPEVCHGKSDVPRLKENLKALHDHCVAEKFRGYSLYDSHNSFIPFAKLGHTASFLINQVVKRSPVNLRKVLGVKKGINPKGVGLFLSAYSLLNGGGVLDRTTTTELVHEKFAWLRDNYSRGYSGYCWGYNYDWPRGDGSVFYAYTPSVVVTAFNCRALFAYYEITGEAAAKDMITSASEFVKNDIHCTIGKSGRCYSYTPVKRDLVINANLLAAEILAYADALAGTTRNLGLIEEVLQFTIEHQNEDGSWFYSVSPDTGEPKKQIDFHQGYVLDSVDILTVLYGLQDKAYQRAIDQGLTYYCERQFHPDGYAYWRVPKVWPVDIHNQSQGIITMCRFARIADKYRVLAMSIYNWTMENMRAPSGRFYYQKYPYLTNKVDYLRWNQAWMFLAMATLYRTLEAEDEAAD